jgi:hypothetical protein
VGDERDETVVASNSAPGAATIGARRRLRLEEVAMLFDSWAGLGRVLLVGTLAYAALVLLLGSRASAR